MDIIDLEQEHPYPPRVTEFTQKFWSNLKAGKFSTTQCRICRRISFPPKPLCSECLSTDIEWINLPENGVVYAFTTIHAGPELFGSDLPYIVGLVDLENGSRIAIRIVGNVEKLQVGSEGKFVCYNYINTPWFVFMI